MALLPWLLCLRLHLLAFYAAYSSHTPTLIHISSLDLALCMETISVDWELGLQADTENYTYWNKPPWFLLKSP